MVPAAWKTSLARALWPAAFAVLANAPARYAVTMREHQFGYGVTAPLVMSMLADMACLGPLLALALVPADWLAARRPGEPSAARAALATAIATVALVVACMWVVSVGAAEFRIQRGSYPALAETKDGLADPAFLRGSAKIALFERYSGPTLVAVFAVIGLLVLYGKARLRRHEPPGSPLGVAIGPAGASLVWAMLASLLFLLTRSLAPASASNAWIPPLVRLAADAGSSRSVVRKGGVREVLAAIDLGPSAVEAGLHRLGFGDGQARCLAHDEHQACLRHPLARPLPGDEPPSNASAPPREAPTPLIRAFLALSAALFDERETPLTIWHVAMESFRADDIHALHPAASPEITPFINAVYAPAGSSQLHAIAFRHAFQSGLRTAHAVSGLWCGLGALPFQLALSRDLVDLKLRCMPDVLRDAGFDTKLYYGSNASFEHLGDFAREHGVEVIDDVRLPKGLPRGAFRAVTDAALLGIAGRASSEAGPFAYRFVLTLSGHSPFDLPEDVSTMTQTRTGNAIAKRFGAALAPEDHRRLVTMAYTDDALAAFVHEIEASPQAARSIFVISADHATADPFLWEKPTGEAMARVPFVFYLPAALIASARDPERVENELHSIERLAATLPVSINDIPALLLALIARHGALKDLPRERRWHTMGGAISSLHFESNDETRRTTAQVWGIDASSRVFMVQSDAPDQLFETGERSVAFSVWNEPLGPLLKDVTGALSAILRACSRPCAGQKDGTSCCASARD